MRTLFVFAILLVCSSAGAAEGSKVTITGAGLPKGGEVTLVSAAKPGPAEKGFQAVLQTKEFDKEHDVARAGPFDAYYTPKGGKPVLAVAGWKAAEGANDLKLGSHLGTVFVRGDDFPRAKSVVITATDDPGPSEKGHAAVQAVPDYKEDLVVPAGFYAVWVVPDNGARAVKVADKIRVLAGRQTVVPE